MKQSAYAKRLAEEKRLAQMDAERITRQFYIDTMQIALNRYPKLRLGYQRIMELTELCEQVRQEYLGTVTRGVEQDVNRAHMDAELLQIMAGREGFIPFEARYPELRKITYDGRK